MDSSRPTKVARAQNPVTRWLPLRDFADRVNAFNQPGGFVCLRADHVDLADEATDLTSCGFNPPSTARLCGPRRSERKIPMVEGRQSTRGRSAISSAKIEYQQIIAWQYPLVGSPALSQVGRDQPFMHPPNQPRRRPVTLATRTEPRNAWARSVANVPLSSPDVTLPDPAERLIVTQPGATDQSVDPRRVGARIHFRMESPGRLSPGCPVA